MKSILLVVQPHGKGKLRLGINTKDSNEIFQKRHIKVLLILEEDLKIETRTTCGPPNFKEILENKKIKKTYDLYHKLIDKWIKSNHFHCYIKGKPTKLKFQLLKDFNSTITLKFAGRTKSYD